ncbi:ABC transporter substrate-binding protein [Fusobacterium mortiferum]|uniref:ABC transporter substrate-binding protein n=1 Tax=Fusobacterium mortiferum TaxID=850 RepID=UPI003569DEBC
MKRLFFIFILLFSQLSFAELEDYIFEKKEEKNKIRISQELRVTTLDPIKLTDIYSKRAFRFIYDTLFEIDIDGKITPKLAQEYHYITKKLLYIKLKDGIKFQDGTSLTSEDVKNSLLRVKTQGALKEFYKNIEEIEIINNREFIIKFSQEDKYIFETLSHTMSSIIKEKAGKIIGTGLYQVEALQKDSVTLSNIEFPYKKIIIDRIFSIQDRLLSLFNNNSDVIYDITNFDIKNGKNLKIIDEKNIDIKKSENIVTTALVFNKNRDLKFKKILNNILNTEESLLPPEIYGKNLENIDKVKNFNINKELNTLNDKEKIVELMILNTEEDRKLAENIKNRLKKYGIIVKTLPYQVDAYYYKIKSKNFDIALQHLVFNKKYPRISLGKVILYDIYDDNLYKEINYFENRFEKEENLEKREKIFMEGVNEISKKLPYIPLEHHSLYILINRALEE